MITVFADSFYFFALLNPRDAAHQKARDFSHSFNGMLVSTAWVLTELGDGLSAPRDRGIFVQVLDRFQKDPLCQLIGPSQGLFREGTKLFRSRSDKGWTLTDCLSFVVMRREGLKDTLTGDHHFVQAGYNALLAK